MRFTLKGARLVDAKMDLAAGEITIEEAHIQEVGAEVVSAEHQIDATGAVIMPGFIDVHTHGGGGYNLHTTDAAEIINYARWVVKTGVTSFLIGVVGTPGALPEAQLRAATEAVEGYMPGLAHAEPLGIHMEGPYINLKRRGAHSPDWLRTPNETETERVLALTHGYLRLITLAPELPGAHALIRRLVAEGVTVSIGHTDADYAQAREAIQLGITHVTHCFNAMRPIHHRDPAVLEAIADVPSIRGELICDGVHVHPATMTLLLKLIGPGRTIGITDALAGAGLVDAVFEFAGQEAHVVCGAAHLKDGTLTGSVLTMDLALRNLLEFTPVTLSEAVGMLTINPARSSGAAGRKGLLQAGYDADFAILDSSLQLQATICQGRVVYATESWRARLGLIEAQA